MTAEDQALQALLREAGVARVDDLVDDRAAEDDLRALFDATAPSWGAAEQERLGATPAVVRPAARAPAVVRRRRVAAKDVWPGRSLLALVAALFLSVGLLSWLPSQGDVGAPGADGATVVAGAGEREAALPQVVAAAQGDTLRLESGLVSGAVDDPLAGLSVLDPALDSALDSALETGLETTSEFDDVASAAGDWTGLEGVPTLDLSDDLDSFGVDLLDTGSI